MGLLGVCRSVIALMSFGVEPSHTSCGLATTATFAKSREPKSSTLPAGTLTGGVVASVAMKAATVSYNIISSVLLNVY